MATELIVRRELTRLVPVTAYDSEMLSAIPIGRDLTAKLSAKRSQKQNSFYWCVLSKVVESHPFYMSSKAVHLAIKTRLGLVEEIHFHDGRMVTVATSTAFDNMDGTEFRGVFDNAIEIILTEILPGITRQELLGEAEAMFGAKYDQVFPLKMKEKQHG